MKINWEDFWQHIKTKVTLSTSIEGLWMARSTIGVKVQGHICPFFGFASSFDREACETKAKFELLERIVFSPYLHNEDSLGQWVSSSHAARPATVKQFLIGATGFYGNGCAIATNEQDAIGHSTREMIERHLCCAIWYKNCPLYELPIKFIKLMGHSFELKFYTTDLHSEDKFVIAVVEAEEINFFAMGAAVKPTAPEAVIHAMGEAVMLFEDVKNNHHGFTVNKRTREKILSLRNGPMSSARKKHFEKILNRCRPTARPCIMLPTCQTIFFRPLGPIVAARTFSEQAFDPRTFENQDGTPLLPLF